jgi:hypothetical protein
MRFYYANEENQPVGPFTRDDLEKMMRSKVLHPETFVCPEGGLEWVSVGSLIAGLSTSPPMTAPPRRTPELSPRDAKVEKNANAAAAAAILFPVIAIILNLIDAAAPFLFVPGRSVGKLLIFLLIAALGVLNARKLLKVPGIAARRPKAVFFAWTGIALFVLSVILLVLLAPGFGTR